MGSRTNEQPCPKCLKPLLPKLPPNHTQADFERRVESHASGRYHDNVSCRGMDPDYPNPEHAREVLESLGATGFEDPGDVGPEVGRERRTKQRAQKPSYLKLQIRDGGLAIYYHGEAALSHMIVGDNLGTGQNYSQEFPSPEDATAAYEELDGVTYEYETPEDLEWLLAFFARSYALETGSSLRSLIRRLRRSLGIPSGEQKEWTEVWHEILEATNDDSV